MEYKLWCASFVTNTLLLKKYLNKTKTRVQRTVSSNCDRGYVDFTNCSPHWEKWKCGLTQWQHGVFKMSFLWRAIPLVQPIFNSNGFISCSYCHVWTNTGSLNLSCNIPGYSFSKQSCIWKFYTYFWLCSGAFRTIIVTEPWT